MSLAGVGSETAYIPFQKADAAEKSRSAKEVAVEPNYSASQACLQ